MREKLKKCKYCQTKNGMSYDDVKSIVGSPGEVSAESGSDEYHIVIITWYGNGTVGGQMPMLHLQTMKLQQKHKLA